MNLKRKNILKLFVCANKTMFQSQTDVFTDIQCSFSDHKEPNNTSKFYLSLKLPKIILRSTYVAVNSNFYPSNIFT